MKRLLLLLALAALPLLARADRADLGAHGTVTFTPPSGWTVSTRNEEGGGAIITLVPPGDANAACLINVTAAPSPEPVTKEKVQQAVLSITQEFVETSVEKKQTLRDFSLASGYGYYCLFTDASRVGQPVEKGQYKVIAVGIVHLRDDVMAAVGISGDDEKGADFTAMMAAVGSLALTPAK